MTSCISAPRNIWVPQENGAEKKGDIFMSYLYVKWNSLCCGRQPTVPSLKHGLCFAGHSRNGGLRRRRRSG